ncbi:MAG: hypothetical protein A2175_01980 [Candidatus Nealsonbacteria bacterium RBG_13_42_11]|uniref:Sodium/calcium exchanger membrane region domain-containing protein n=1 Tax=Candidatus Nealsonbacteria bacterium RBG_13_42_11 TaxID=1801663 RepID=A0A1G2E1E2_9BACT|nr:MAG: hypothetical protein A2175_01980 [Candidatus Nealsonbacteria bacterium RBG_13_42_11]
MLWFCILIFIASCLLLIFAGKWLVDALSRIALVLSLKEFVVAFFIMALGTSIPNLMIGIVSALNGVPELSFGDVVGANIFDLSIVIGLAALISKAGLSSKSRTVQGSSAFTIIIALLPLLLIFDQNLSRADGVVLLLSFIIYTSWLFSKKERFTKIYEQAPEIINLKNLFKDIGIIILGVILLLLGGQGIVKSATLFSEIFNAPLGLIGMFIVAIGTCLPEAIFSLHAARKGQDWMILGNLMGSVVITATLILGIVAIIQPVKIVDFSPFAIARAFLLASAIFFFIFLRSDHKITRKEGIFLIGIYIVFLIVEILTI